MHARTQQGGFAPAGATAEDDPFCFDIEDNMDTQGLPPAGSQPAAPGTIAWYRERLDDPLYEGAHVRLRDVVYVKADLKQRDRIPDGAMDRCVGTAAIID